MLKQLRIAWLLIWVCSNCMTIISWFRIFGTWKNLFCDTLRFETAKTQWIMAVLTKLGVLWTRIWTFEESQSAASVYWPLWRSVIYFLLWFRSDSFLGFSPWSKCAEHAHQLLESTPRLHLNLSQLPWHCIGSHVTQVWKSNATWNPPTQTGTLENELPCRGLFRVGNDVESLRPD